MNRTFGRLGMVFVLGPVLAFGLAACDTAEERAEVHYASAIALLDTGDADRALVELRNVFKLNGSHREGRRLYAGTQRARGEVADAFGNYLRLVEFYPDDVPARQALAEMAPELGDWDEAARHAGAGLALAPDDTTFRAVMAAVDYRAALQRRDDPARAVAVATARAILDGGASVWAARTVVVDDLVMRGAPDAALAEIDAALADRPEDPAMHQARLRLLSQAGDDTATEAQLRRMVVMFPKDTDLRNRLISWYGQRDRIDDVKTYLRTLAAANPADAWPQITLVQVVRATNGAEAALAELDTQAGVAPAPGLALRYREFAALIRFDEGATDTAIDDLRAVVTAAEAAGETGEALRDAQVTLAQMLRETDDGPAAKSVIDSVLAADEGHVGALQMRAAWAIEEDRTGDAIVALRRALAEAPRNPEVMTLMAMAHLRDGSRDLAGERLALAVEVSGRGVNESLRYARFLLEGDRPIPAEAVLTEALLIHPADVGLLSAQTELRLQRGELERAAQSLSLLAQLAEVDPDVAPVVARLRTLYLQQAGDQAGALAYLEALVAGGSFDISAVALIVQTHLENDDLGAAAGYLDMLLGQTPGDQSLLFLRAGVHRQAGEDTEAEAIYRNLVADRPDAEGPARELYTLLFEQGRNDEADETLRAAIAAQPGNATLRWMYAGAQELRGDIEGAIATYEELYAEDSANDVFANNLASLIATHRATPDALERAHAIARRLRASDVPAFRDTYGWVEFRRGNAAEALGHLRFAAAGLPDSGPVHYHLALALEATGDRAAARSTLTRALDLGGLADDAEARAALVRLNAGTGQ